MIFKKIYISGVIAYALKQHWGPTVSHDVKFINRIKGILCGFPLQELDLITPTEFLQIHQEVFEHIGACSHRQRAVILNLNTFTPLRNTKRGSSYKKRLILILKQKPTSSGNFTLYFKNTLQSSLTSTVVVLKNPFPQMILKNFCHHYLDESISNFFVVE